MQRSHKLHLPPQVELPPPKRSRRIFKTDDNTKKTSGVLLSPKIVQSQPAYYIENCRRKTCIDDCNILPSIRIIFSGVFIVVKIHYPFAINNPTVITTASAMHKYVDIAAYNVLIVSHSLHHMPVRSISQIRSSFR